MTYRSILSAPALHCEPTVLVFTLIGGMFVHQCLIGNACGKSSPWLE